MAAGSCSAGPQHVRAHGRASKAGGSKRGSVPCHRGRASISIAAPQYDGVINAPGSGGREMP